MCPAWWNPFCQTARKYPVITVRAHTGELQTYPPVSMEFDTQLNAVRTVSMPANVSADLCVARH